MNSHNIYEEKRLPLTSALRRKQLDDIQIKLANEIGVPSNIEKIGVKQ